MRAKQVTALMMAATLAVTGNGVTAFAEPVANVEAEVEVTEDSEDVTKSAQQDASSDVTVETKTSATTVKAGATVTVTTTVKGDKLTNGTLTVKSYELIATKSAVDTTIATSADGTFVFAPEKDTTYKVKAVFTHAIEKNEYYSEKALDAFTIEAASIATNRLHVPEVTTISNKDGAALNTTAAPEVTAALEAANKLDGAYGKWTVKDDAVDERSHGKSADQIITFGIRECKDVKCWADYAAKRFPEKSLILSGVSMGSASVMMASVLSLPSSVKALICDCGYTAPAEIIKETIRSFHLPVSFCYALLHFGARIFGHFNLSESTALSAVKQTKLPILFIHGDHDSIVPPKMCDELYDACASRKKKLIITGSQHAVNAMADFDSYEREIMNFLKESGIKI